MPDQIEPSLWPDMLHCVSQISFGYTISSYDLITLFKTQLFEGFKPQPFGLESILRPHHQQAF